MNSSISSDRKKAALEVILELSSIFFYIWIVERSMAQWFRAFFFWAVCIGFPLFCIWLEQGDLTEFSLDWNQFLKSLRGIIWFTLAATLFLVSVSLYFEEFSYDGKLLFRLPEYFFWAFLQQIGFQTFLTRRVQRVILNPYGTAFVSSTLFALIHLPNPALFFLTWIGGFFWALSFQLAPNLYVISISHGWCAVVALYCIPPQWMHGLRIGPSYWNF